MGRLYVDILPCDECENQGIFGICRKEHDVTYIDGCKKCGTMFNMNWYFEEEKCPDFEQRYFDDPSGS